MSEALDPEVIADLQLRAASVYDRTRTGREATWSAPDIVTEWPCRMQNCRVPVEVTQEPIDQLAMFNRELERRGEDPIRTNEVMICDSHRKLLAWKRSDSAAKKRERMSDNIRRIKASMKPRNEHDIIAELNRDGHPDVPALLEAIETRQKLAGSSKRERKASI